MCELNILMLNGVTYKIQNHQHNHHGPIDDPIITIHEYLRLVLVPGVETEYSSLNSF